MMRRKWGRSFARCVLLVIALGWEDVALAQEASSPGVTSGSAENGDMPRIMEVVEQLQSQVHGLSADLKEVRAEQASIVAELTALRRKLAASNDHMTATAAPPEDAKGGSAGYGSVIPGGVAADPSSFCSSPSSSISSLSRSSSTSSSLTSSSSSSSAAPDSRQDDSREVLPSYKEDLQLLNAKVTEQSQTKVESGSKYRVRLSGTMLLNLFSSAGAVDNLDFPEFAVPGLSGDPDSSKAFGGTIRQSQLRLQGFGPDVAGARTSAEVKFDFAGGFPQAPNGALLGIARLRTGTLRFDWSNTSVVAGQDGLFFAPTSATSTASLAVPAFSYSGNLWGWTPQVRVEHRFKLRESSQIAVQGGILESLSGDVPADQYKRETTWGEQSAGPAYAARAQYTREIFGQQLVVGAGGYYGRQSWGFGRNVNAWAGTADITVPLTRTLELSGAFYRGRALGGFGGAIGQTAIWKGSFLDPSVEIYGVDSIGGWGQLKFRATSKLQFNGAVGQDSPYTSELREHGGNPYYDNVFLSRNLTPFANFVYQPRSDMLFSLEYRFLSTTILDAGSKSAHQVNLSIGYLF